MVIFHSYVSLPEGKSQKKISQVPWNHHDSPMKISLGSRHQHTYSTLLLHLMPGSRHHGVLASLLHILAQNPNICTLDEGVNHPLGMVYIYIIYGFHMDFIWISYGFHMDFIWISYGISYGFHMAMDQYLLIPFLVGWTSINPSYFDVSYRGTRFWHTAIYIYIHTLW